jgi:hypothetical protein
MTSISLRRLAIASLVWLCASSALAQTPVVVLDFEGPGASRVRQMAIRGLQSRVDLTDRSSFTDAAGSMSSDSDYANGAAAAGVNAILEGRVERDGRNFVATITVRGGDGAIITEMSVQNRNANRLGADVRRQIWRELGDAIENAPAPQANEPDVPDEPLTPVGGGGSGAVVVLAFDGPGADTARDAVAEALEAAGIDVSRGDASDASGRVEEAREAGARALVGGSVSRDGRNLTTTVVVYNGSDGESLGEQSFEGRNASAMLDEIRGGLWSSIGSMVEQGAVPEGDDDGGGDDSSGPSGPRPSPLIIGAYLRAFNRDFSYSDDLAVVRPSSGAAGLREYSLPLGPALELEGTWYPIAHFSDSFAANFGLDLGFMYAFGIESSECRPRRDAQGNCTAPATEIAFPTSSLGYSFGLRMRIPVDSVEPYIQVAYGAHSFRIEALASDPKPEVPDVDYGFLRFGGGARMQFGPIILEPRLALLLLLGTGQFEEADWFPRSGGLGFEGMFRVGVEIVEFFEVHASFNYQQFGMSMNNEPGDDINRVAGGALDRYISGSLGVALKIPASEGDAGYTEE